MRRRLTALTVAFALLWSAAPPAHALLQPAQTTVNAGATVRLQAPIPDVARWSLTATELCTGSVRRTLTGGAASGEWATDFVASADDGQPLVGGEYRLQLRAWNAAGVLAMLPIEATLSVLGTPSAEVCTRAQAAPKGDVLSQGIAAVKATTAQKVVITTAGDVGYAAVAASYAHGFSLPLVLLPAKASTTALVRLLVARKLGVVLIGPPAAVSTTTEKALKSKKLKVVRISGTDRNATAAEVALALRPQPGTPAVYASLAGAPEHIALAASYANARNLPLLPVGTFVPTPVANVIKTLGLKGGVAIGDSDRVTDAAIAKLPQVVRVLGKDLESTSFVLARTAPVATSTLVVGSALRSDPLLLVWRSQSGDLQLLLDDFPTAVQSWLTARGDLLRIAAADDRVEPAILERLGAFLLARGPVGALPAMALQALPAATLPATFAISGSGFGHGVGMSQWGAYGMAKEGYSGTAILQHYFTGSVVAPVVDTVDINVSLLSRVGTAAFRLEKLTDANATMELADASGVARTALIGDVVTVTYASNGAMSVAVKSANGASFEPFTTTALTLKWAGNRDPGTASGIDGLVRVAGSASSIGSGKRYRFGILSITPAKVSGALKLGLQVNNILRLRDEYLYGISEISSSWPEAALQAQVIAARAYGLKQVEAGITRDCACHVDDDTDDQNFVGWGKLAETSGGTNVGLRWKAAVDATFVDDTQSLALTYGGQVISANYSAASGGATRSNEEVWGKVPAPYLRSVPDPWSLKYAPANVARWKPRVFTQAQMATAFGAPDVQYLDLSDRYPNGAVNNAVAVSSTGQRFALTAAALKYRLNAAVGDTTGITAGLPSSWFWRADESIDGTSATAAALDLSTTPNLSVLGNHLYKSTTVVFLQEDANAPAMLTAAAAFAGAMQYGVLLNSGETLTAAVVKELKDRKTARIITVGPIPTAVQSGLAALKVPIASVAAASPAALSAALAMQRPAGASAAAVLVAAADTRSHALAVSLAARTGAALYLVDGPTIAPEVSAVLARTAPTVTYVVGNAEAIPDELAAGLVGVKRLATGDPALASTIALSNGLTNAGQAVAVIAPTTPTMIAVLIAATGYPLAYATGTPSAEWLHVLRVSPRLAVIVRAADADPAFIAALQRP